MKKNKKVFNPVLGRYFKKGEEIVLAMFIKQAPLLIEKWKSSGSSLLFHEYLLKVDNDAPVKGVIHKFFAKRYKSVVEALVAIWKESEFESFDIFLEYHHTRAIESTPKNK